MIMSYQDCKFKEDSLPTNELPDDPDGIISDQTEGVVNEGRTDDDAQAAVLLINQLCRLPPLRQFNSRSRLLLLPLLLSYSGPLRSFLTFEGHRSRTMQMVEHIASSKNTASRSWCHMFAFCFHLYAPPNEPTFTRYACRSELESSEGGRLFASLFSLPKSNYQRMTKADSFVSYPVYCF